MDYRMSAAVCFPDANGDLVEGRINRTGVRCGHVQVQAPSQIGAILLWVHVRELTPVLQDDGRQKVRPVLKPAPGRVNNPYL
jgi:hypothetical protein